MEILDLHQMFRFVLWWLIRTVSFGNGFDQTDLSVPCNSIVCSGQNASKMSLGVQLHRTNIPINLLSHCNPVILSAYASYCLPDFFNISYRDLTWFDCLCIVLGTSAHPHESVKIKQDGTQRASTKLNGDIGMDRPIVRSNLNDLYDPRLDAVGSEMTVEDVADWISYSVQLPQYAEFARTHSISGGTLSLLIENNGARLSSIGIRDEIHRVQLLRFLKLRYAGLGERPHDVSNFTCTISPSTRCSSEADEESCAYRRVHTSWIAPAQNVSQTFQLQRRDVKGSWTLVFAGSDSEYVDFIDTRNEPLLYQITTWNAYGRSSRVYTHCRPALIKTPANLDTNAAESNSDGTFFDYTFPFMQSCQKWKSEISTCKMKWSLLCSLYQYKGSHCWLDETIIFIILSIFLIRSYIYGDADFLLRLLRRLPPNISTQVVVKTFTDKVENVQTAQEALVDASAIVLWKKPLDNGIPIVFYRICWTRMKTRETMCVRVRDPSRSTAIRVDHLRRGETYNFRVEATNSFGLTSRSTNSTYLVPKLNSRTTCYHLDLSVARSLLQNSACKKRCHLCFKQLSCRETSWKTDQQSSKRLPTCFSAKEKRSKFFSTKSTSLPSIPHNKPQISKRRGSWYSWSLEIGLNRIFLHTCSICDELFCHDHRGKVTHPKLFGCPAVDGQCICMSCFLQRE